MVNETYVQLRHMGSRSNGAHCEEADYIRLPSRVS